MPLAKSKTGVARPSVLLSVLIKTGELLSFTMHFFARFWRRPFEFRELDHQPDEIGSKSVILTAVTGLAIGMVLAMQGRGALVPFGAEAVPASMIEEGFLDHLSPTRCLTA
ncbi:MAG: hypothetical protein E2O85_04750 [Bacteroidetes bacterium]|nr:MAG: hypothetical protein E2O85_04750 [Bacteroidota bacterium]